MFGALKRGFRSMASLILVSNVVGEVRPKRTLGASRGFLAAARLSCYICYLMVNKHIYINWVDITKIKSFVSITTTMRFDVHVGPIKHVNLAEDESV